MESIFDFCGNGEKESVCEDDLSDFEVPVLSEKEQRRITLGWKILEMKCVYYRPDLIHPSRIAEVSVKDAVYDALESEYKQLCDELEEEPSASDMVGFDLDRPSCRLVVWKLGKSVVV